MKYYLIAGEASGDLHASRLMKALRQEDADAQFRFYGGDLMAAEGGTLVRHYRELAYMGFVPVLLHLRTILSAQKACVSDIRQWQPDVVILVDYPGFNLQVAKAVHGQTRVYYYISPKLWAWKEWRIKSIRRYVDELFSILPFEVDFFEGKHHYPIHYVGNPTADEVSEFRQQHTPTDAAEAGRKTIALLAGSRRQEIKDNLPAMLKASAVYRGYDIIVAGAPGIDEAYYRPFMQGYGASIVFGQTYQLLSRATMALVTSGTATLETALFGVPQVVCYKTPVPRLIRFAFNHFIHCKYISLVNLIADDEVVPELLADRFSVKNIRKAMHHIAPGRKGRRQMLEGYERVRQALGNRRAPEEAARIMVGLIRKN